MLHLKVHCKLNGMTDENCIHVADEKLSVRNKPSLLYSLDGFSTSGLMKCLRALIVNSAAFPGYNSM